ncbi:PST family polysaccharide transporter [Cytobacillus eiseniae]|uniref:PST family polysaccharide transporter n=1 Tax=Cytobacillus eiseniae TaxID=762947 RepID=A0ABS4RI57_9BACI|nr:polysaccharide biosynthesis protein [Cytobacillus eiseniae]MBP2242590.1 PST family polysaccharide transporter [Cytobacillus eiseniae]
MRPEKRSSDFLKGTLILTVAALIIKVLSAIYRVPFQNMVGDVGFYIYQQVYPFYGVAFVLATSGFPVVISKMYTEHIAKKGKQDIQSFFIICTMVLMAIGLSCFAFLYLGAEWLAVQMNDPQLAPLLRMVSITFLIIPVIALFRGYFQGVGNMVPTAVSQVGEQLVRVLLIFLAAFVLIHQGYDLYIVGSGAVLGSVIGGIVSILILFLYYWMGKERPITKIQLGDFKDSGKIVKSLLTQGLAICISSMLLILMQLADSLNLYAVLVTTGLDSEEAKELKGIYDRGQPLIQLGMVVATSMSLSLVPLITSEKLKEKQGLIHDKIRLALQIGLFIGVGATVGLWSIMKQTNTMLFENSDGSNVLGVLSLLILFTSIIITTMAILQGLGIIYFPAMMVILGFGFKYLLNIILIPPFGTLGAAIASAIALCVIMMVLLYRLKVFLKKGFMNIRFIFIVIVAAIVMMIVLKVYLFITGHLPHNGYGRLFAGFQAISAVVIGGITYLWIVLKGRTFKEEELMMLPFGSKLLLFLPKRKRR